MVRPPMSSVIPGFSDLVNCKFAMSSSQRFSISSPSFSRSASSNFLSSASMSSITSWPTSGSFFLAPVPRSICWVIRWLPVLTRASVYPHCGLAKQGFLRYFCADTRVSEGRRPFSEKLRKSTEPFDLGGHEVSCGPMSVGAPPKILAGKYQLERELGRGGMGSVWLAQHLTLHSPVAIKLIDETVVTNPEALTRFLREAQAAASLRSPHVVQILDHGVDNGVPFIVMELLDGESLAARIERVRRLSPQETARIMTQVGRAMTKAHEAGVVHRDLKPDNIFLVRNDEEELAKVLDFGIAKSSTHGAAASVASTTRTGSVLGTPYYMSPEQAEGAKGVDHRTDIWAMGVIACECLVGSRPFDAETLGALLLAICAREMPVPSRVGPVPPAFDAWFARACSRDVGQRFATAKEAAQELRSVCAGESMSAYAGLPVLGPRAPVQAASLPLSTTTGHLSLSSANQLPKKSAAPWVALG